MDLNVVLNAMAYASSVSLEDRIALSVTEAQDKLTFHISRELDDQQPDDLVAFWKEQWLRFRVLSKNLTHCHARDDLGYFDSEVGLSPVAVATTEDIVEAIILRGVPKLRVLLEDYKFSYEYGWLSYYWRCILDPVHRDLYKVLDKMHLLLSRLQKLLAVTEINKPVLVSTTRQLLALKEEYEREEDVWLEKHADRAAYRDYVEHGGPKPKIDCTSLDLSHIRHTQQYFSLHMQMPRRSTKDYQDVPFCRCTQSSCSALQSLRNSSHGWILSSR